MTDEELEIREFLLHEAEALSSAAGHLPTAQQMLWRAGTPRARGTTITDLPPLSLGLS